MSSTGTSEWEPLESKTSAVLALRSTNENTASVAFSLALASNQFPSNMNEIMNAAPSKKTCSVDEKIGGKNCKYGANTTKDDQIIAVVVPM